MADWHSTREYRVWRALVIRRDSGCVICGTLISRQAHHLDDASYHPESRFDVDNGVTLCRDHHTSLHCDYKRSFRMKTTKKDFEEYHKICKLAVLKGIKK